MKINATRPNIMAWSSLFVGMFYHESWGPSKNPAAACTWFEKAARNKIPAAENDWGDCLAQGITQAADSAAALQWHETAARRWHLISACMAADYDIQGKGVPQDLQRGIALCTEVAQNTPASLAN